MQATLESAIGYLMNVILIGLACLDAWLALDWLQVVMCFVLGIITAILLSALTGLWRRSWNKVPPPLSGGEYFAGALAFLATVPVVPLCWALLHGTQAVSNSFAVARETLFPAADRPDSDGGWRRATFLNAARDLRQAGLEDFSRIQSPEAGGTRLPITKAESAKLVGQTYRDALAKRFAEGKMGDAVRAWRGVAANFPPGEAEPPPAIALPPGNLATADIGEWPALKGMMNHQLDEISSRLQERTLEVRRHAILMICLPAVLFHGFAFLRLARNAYRDLRLDP